MQGWATGKADELQVPTSQDIAAGKPIRLSSDPDWLRSYARKGDHEEMTIQEFFASFNEQGIDFDHAYGFQCMDLAEEYNRDVVGAPRLWGNAIDVWTNFPASRYTRIGNTPDNFPNEGDLILWNTNVGRFGHIAVCQTADPNSLTSFDQNWPLGSVCHFQWHNYDNVLGWLRPNW